MNDSKARIAEITSRLWEMVAQEFGGAPDPALVNEVRQLVSELRSLLPNDALSQRLSNLARGVETACSPGKWRRQGLDRVRQFAREDAYVLKSHA